MQSVSLPGFDPLVFFAKLSERERKVAFFTSGDWTVLAWNPVRTIRRTDASIFAALEREQQKRRSSYSGTLPFVGGAIGYIAYEVGKRGGVFHVYDQAVLWNGKKVVVVGGKKFVTDIRKIQSRVSPSLESQREKGLGLSTVALAKAEVEVGARDHLRWQPSLTRSEYAKAFRSIQKDIRNGEYYQLNLTYTLKAFSSVAHRELFVSLLQRNPAACASYVEDGTRAILSLSPERFVTIDRGVITTRPIKGTRPRGRNAADDLRQQRALLVSEKEAAELNMITDLLRNDIGKVSEIGSVRVKEHRALQKNPTVWHTYSVIEGRLRKTLHPVRAIESMFPGGSITGCPKQAAMKRICELETEERGAYCGSMLMQSDHGLLDSTVLIRTIVADGKRLSLGIGGGIVADSILEDEWQETKQKAKAFLPSPLDPWNADTFGVFETMRVEDGVICDLNAHLRRLQQSATLLRMKLPESIAAICSRLKTEALMSRFPLARVKVVCTPEDVLLEIRPLTMDARDRTGASVTVIACDRAIPEAKALPYIREWNAHEAARKQGFDEALLQDTSGRILEAAYANLFWVKDGTLFTADQNVLRGITREHILRLAKKKKIPLRYRSAKASDLLSADEVFLTKSTTGITPVIKINTTLIGSGKTGSMTEDLMRNYEGYRG